MEPHYNYFSHLTSVSIVFLHGRLLLFHTTPCSPDGFFDGSPDGFFDGYPDGFPRSLPVVISGEDCYTEGAGLRTLLIPDRPDISKKERWIQRGTM